MKVLSTALNPKQSELFYKITNGVETDKVFFQQEFAVQSAWAKELYLSSYLSKEENDRIYENLERMRFLIEKGEYVWSIEDEDIHMAIEKEITKVDVHLGKKMHLGRSRNDLIATSLKLYIANFYCDLKGAVSDLIQVLLFLAQKDIECIVPSFTHAQAAQPVRMSHIWNFHAINFLSDLNRISSLNKSCLTVMPLGSAAIAGTHLKLDLQRMANALGFASPCMNSIYGVSDRDFLIEAAFCVSMISLHVVRLCEDIIQYSSTHLAVLRLPKDWSSGSSIMPNKKNPDFFEVLRAKSKNLMGLVSSGMSMSSSFGGGYASDFHEMKKMILRDISEVLIILKGMKEALVDFEMDLKNSEKSLLLGCILATDKAHFLVSEGMAFRDAYNKVAEFVNLNESSGDKMEFNKNDFLQSVESKESSGGISKRQTVKTISWIQEQMQKQILKT